MEQVTPADLNEPNLLGRIFPFFCALVALVTFGYARFDPYQIDGDAVAYMDIGDNLRAHHWAGIVNGYWHPMYPAFLSVGHVLFHATLATELHAYYMVNFGIFVMEMLAMVCFTDAIVRLREKLSEPASQRAGYLMDRTTLRYLGLTLLVIASQRELSLGRVRPDALLQAFLLFAIAALMAHLASGKLHYAAWMGVALGCAYLTKSFAFVFGLICILAIVVFRWVWMQHKPARIAVSALVALICFAALAGPYVAALSRQKGRLDFGDSGALNYAWYVSGTEKMHLQPYQTSQFGSAEVHLKHPEKELLHSPLVLSYAEMPYGTYPDWFDPTYWNEQIRPHLNLHGEIARIARNLELVTRYLLNHLEGLLLLTLLVLLGARFALAWRPGANAFWLVPLLLGVVIWGIYGIVNTEERYVTVAYLNIVLALFSALSLPASSRALSLRSTASALVLLLAVVSVGESLRTVLELRRQTSLRGLPGGWYGAEIFHAADGLKALGVKPGDSVACVGADACLVDHYWARLAGVRILTEVYDPDLPPDAFLRELPNREQVYYLVRAQGAKALVGDFGEARMSGDVAKGWKQLGGSRYYALPF